MIDAHLEKKLECLNLCFFFNSTGIWIQHIEKPQNQVHMCNLKNISDQWKLLSPKFSIVACIHWLLLICRIIIVKRIFHDLNLSGEGCLPPLAVKQARSRCMVQKNPWVAKSIKKRKKGKKLRTTPKSSLDTKTVKIQ